MKNIDLHIKELNTYGRKGRRGNLLGMEPYVVPGDYASPESFGQKLEGYLSVARDEGWINGRTVVLWPEYIGTWLSVSGEKPAPTLQGVVENLIQAHQQEYNGFYATAKEQNKTYAALFRTKAHEMAAAYQSVF
ncbi:MAG TPA: hypothetical protein VJ785_17910, partial [Anaerolineales bacterium]|nr:hypothetical protein [Anaerolineales bacterium]